MGEDGQFGRPRKAELTKRAHSVALILARELGAAKVTMEGVAARSGIAKTTLYRRWPSAPNLVMDAFLADLRPLIAYRKGETLHQVLVYAITDLAAALDGDRRQLLCHLVAAAQSDLVLRQAFWDNWIYPRRKEGLKALQAAGLRRRQGEIILDLLFGAFYYRILIPYAPIDAVWVKDIVDQVMPQVSIEVKS